MCTVAKETGENVYEENINFTDCIFGKHSSFNCVYITGMSWLYLLWPPSVPGGEMTCFSE